MLYTLLVLNYDQIERNTNIYNMDICYCPFCGVDCKQLVVKTMFILSLQEKTFLRSSRHKRACTSKQKLKS